jgi:hypothetical protein
MHPQTSVRAEEDLLLHVAKCPALEEVEVEAHCGVEEGHGGWAPGCSSLMLRHAPALAACTRLEVLKLRLAPHWNYSASPVTRMGPSQEPREAGAPCTPGELLEPLSLLPALRQVGRWARLWAGVEGLGLPASQSAHGWVAPLHCTLGLPPPSCLQSGT